MAVEEQQEVDEYPIGEYDLTSSPNDFNLSSLVNFIETGIFKIPVFQRNYVWDLKRASKLIESLLIGLPIPQLFLYEAEKNSFLVIDGQQRLMTIYYFIKGRFPRTEKRDELRQIFDLQKSIPEDIFSDDTYFRKFNLALDNPNGQTQNKFNKMNYNTLGDYKNTLALRTLRTITVRPTSPGNDDSAAFELFNRLNTGGVNLSSQEIRMSLYHSTFMDQLLLLNRDEKWRRFFSSKVDIHLRDVEIILRVLALSNDYTRYTDPMTKFINSYAKAMKKAGDQEVMTATSPFNTFLSRADQLPDDVFKSIRNRFITTLFESVFIAAQGIDGPIDASEIEKLKSDPRFVTLGKGSTTNTDNLKERVQIASRLLRGE